MDKVDRALECSVIDWLQWTEWDEVLDVKHPAQLALEMISTRKKYCLKLRTEIEELKAENDKLKSDITILEGRIEGLRDGLIIPKKDKEK